MLHLQVPLRLCQVDRSQNKTIKMDCMSTNIPLLCHVPIKPNICTRIEIYKRTQTNTIKNRLALCKIFSQPSKLILPPDVTTRLRSLALEEWFFRIWRISYRCQFIWELKKTQLKCCCFLNDLEWWFWELLINNLKSSVPAWSWETRTNWPAVDWHWW